jgi:CRISPR-associated endonuclease/helicase Cas3
VLVFDEAQMIPIDYLKPCVHAIRELVTNYNCTAVLATATQSSLDSYFVPKEGEKFNGLKPAEICEKPEEMYEFFRRVKYEVIPGTLTDDDLVDRLNAHDQVLCVVNTRKRAQQIAEELSKLSESQQEPNGTVFHLSTTMVPMHRTDVLNKIRDKLKAGEKCRVVSTSLIEAGVDVDFPALYREKAGLDSVIQAAGRCNREGKRSMDDSVAYVFTMEPKAPRGISVNVAAYEDTARAYEDIASLDSIKHYFEQLRYIKGEDALDIKDVVKDFNVGAGTLSFPFADVAKAFNLIEQNTKAVMAPYDKDGEALSGRLLSGERSKELFRAIQPYSVSLYENDIKVLRELGAVISLDEGELYVLAHPEIYYDGLYGVTLRPSGGYALMS